MAYYKLSDSAEIEAQSLSTISDAVLHTVDEISVISELTTSEASQNATRDFLS